jgi:hypothetical protein
MIIKYLEDKINKRHALTSALDLEYSTMDSESNENQELILNYTQEMESELYKLNIEIALLEDILGKTAVK